MRATIEKDAIEFATRLPMMWATFEGSLLVEMITQAAKPSRILKARIVPTGTILKRFCGENHLCLDVVRVSQPKRRNSHG